MAAPNPAFANNARLVVRYQQGDAAAAEELLRLNARLVTKIAARYAGMATSLEFVDLVIEGQLGLLHAAGKFAPERGHQFSTYAHHWIRQACARAIDTQDRAIRIPTNQTERKRRPLAALPSVTASLDEPLPDEGGRLGDFLPAPDDVEREVVGRAWVLAAMRGAGLTAIERAVLERRLEGQRLVEVATALGRSREGVRCIEERSLGKVRTWATNQSGPAAGRAPGAGPQ